MHRLQSRKIQKISARNRAGHMDVQKHKKMQRPAPRRKLPKITRLPVDFYKFIRYALGSYGLERNG